MFYNRDILDPILNNLMQKTDAKLREIQIAKCPRFIDIELEEITSKAYRYMEQDYVASNRLFRVNNPKEIINASKLKTGYIGPIQTLIDDDVLKAFILYFDDKFIEWSMIECIMDDRYMYLNINLPTTLDLVMGDASSPVTITAPNFYVPLTIIETEFLDDITIEVSCVDSSMIGVVRFCTYVMTPFSITPTLVTFKIPKLAILNSYNLNKVNWVYITPIASFVLKSVRMYSDTTANIAVTKINTMLINDKVEYTEGRSSINYLTSPDKVDTKFLFVNRQFVNEWLILSNRLPYKISTISFKFPLYGEIPASPVLAYFSTPSAINAKYKLFKENLITFSSNMGITETYLEEKGLNTFYKSAPLFRDAGSYLKYFYWYDESNVDKLNLIQQKIDLLTKIKANQALPAFTNTLTSFNFIYDVSKSYEENMDNFITYISQHDTLLLSRYTDINKSIYSKIYTGAQVAAMSTLINNDYIFNVSKNINNRYNNGVIVFINGLLLDLNKLKDENTSYEIAVPKTILSTDCIEILFFVDINNNVISLDTSGADLGGIISVTYSNVGNDITTPALFSQQYQSHSYSLPIDPALQYRFGNEDVLNWPSDSIVELSIPLLYRNKEVVVASYRRFVCDTRILASIGTIALGDKFKYCSNKDQYMIFLNNRKLDKESYEILLNDTSMPFSERVIMLTNIITIGDVLSIIYVPEEIKETKISGGLLSHGIISLPDANKVQGAYFFINGKKIPQKDIEILSSKTVKIKADTKSLKNLVMIDSLSVIDQALFAIKASTEMWNTVVSAMSLSEIQALAGNSINMTDVETDIYSNAYARDMVIYEVIRKFFIEKAASTSIDASIDFLYAYDGSILEDGDVITIDASRESINYLPLNV